MTTTNGDLVVHPTTGEIVELSTAGDVQLVELVDQLAEFARQVRDAKTYVSEELLRRMDRNASWTLHTAAGTATGSSPKQAIEWDANALVDVLNELVNEELISADAAGKALKTEVSYKPQVAGLNAIKKLSADIAERIDTCGTPVEKTRRVSVKPRSAS